MVFTLVRKASKKKVFMAGNWRETARGKAKGRASTALTSHWKLLWRALAERSSPAQESRLATSFSYCAGGPGRARCRVRLEGEGASGFVPWSAREPCIPPGLGSRVSGVRSDQLATGLRNKELSKGQDISGRTWAKLVLCSTPRVGWLEGLLSAICLSFLSLLLAKKVEKSKTFGLLQAGLGFLAWKKLPL